MTWVRTSTGRDGVHGYSTWFWLEGAGLPPGSQQAAFSQLCDSFLDCRECHGAQLLSAWDQTSSACGSKKKFSMVFAFRTF